jgi:hypothetical protein
VAAGDFVQRMLYLFPGDWVKFCSLMKGSRLSPGRFLYFSTLFFILTFDKGYNCII